MTDGKNATRGKEVPVDGRGGGGTGQPVWLPGNVGGAWRIGGTVHRTWARGRQRLRRIRLLLH